MKKIEQMNLKLNEFTPKQYQGNKFQMKKFIGLDESIALVKAIIDTHIKNKIEDDDVESLYFTHEDSIVLLTTLDVMIIDQCTNIDVDKIEYENILKSGLSHEILSNIYDYNNIKEAMSLEIQKHNFELTMYSMIDDVVGTEEITKNQLDDFSKVLEDVDIDLIKKLITNDVDKALKKDVKTNIKDKKKVN